MKVITTLNLEIMEEITKDLTRKWSINELSKKLNKHYRPIHAAIQSLIKEGFLIKNKNNLLEPTFKDTFLLELAEKQRIIKQNNKEIKIIKERLSKLKIVFF